MRLVLDQFRPILDLFCIIEGLKAKHFEMGAKYHTIGRH